MSSVHTTSAIAVVSMEDHDILFQYNGLAFDRHTSIPSKIVFNLSSFNCLPMGISNWLTHWCKEKDIWRMETVMRFLLWKTMRSSWSWKHYINFATISCVPWFCICWNNIIQTTNKHSYCSLGNNCIIYLCIIYLRVILWLWGLTSEIITADAQGFTKLSIITLVDTSKTLFNWYFEGSNLKSLCADIREKTFKRANYTQFWIHLAAMGWTAAIF